MITKKIDKFADFLMKNETNPNIDKDIIVYGLTSAIEQGASLITIIILGWYFGLIVEVVVFFVSFSLIRKYAGGYHCKKSINCYFMSNIIIISVLLIIKYIPSEYILSSCIAILLVSIPSLFKFSPIETPSKPLDCEEQIYYRKKTLSNLTIEFLIIIFALIFNIDIIGFVMCLGILMSSILVILQKLIYLVQK